MYLTRNEERTTLQGLSDELIRQQDTKRDYVVDTRRMTLTTEGESILSFDDGAMEHDEGVQGGPLTEHGHHQLRAHVDVPARYYNRMRSDAPELLDRNVMHWLHNPPAGRADRRMVRMLDGRVRALLSDRYRRLDNLDLMERAILPELAEREGELTFHVASLTPEKMHVRALLPGLQREVRRGDIVQAGVQIINSEVGLGALSVTPFIWRLVCLNGMVANVGAMRALHVGRKAEEEAYAIWRDDTMRADDHAFFLKVRDAVGAALMETQFELIVEELREAATGERIADPVAATERLASTFELLETEQGSLLRHLAEGGDLSKWGAANALTRMAKDVETFDRQAELEAMGHALVTMADRQWEAIAA